MVLVRLPTILQSAKCLLDELCVKHVGFRVVPSRECQSGLELCERRVVVAKPGGLHKLSKRIAKHSLGTLID
jgi:hypothetical protein